MGLNKNGMRAMLDAIREKCVKITIKREIEVIMWYLDTPLSIVFEYNKFLIK